MTSLRINTGRAIAGKIGSKERMEFMSIGESINLASRHQGATRHHADLLVSEYSDVAARSAFPSNRSVKSPSRATLTALEHP
jgi:class 3 adenylate cyclase